MQLAAILDALQSALPAAGDFLASAWRAWSHAAAPIAVAALWQGAAVAAGLAICLRLAPRISAAHRFAAWAAGFAALVCLPFLPLLSQFNAGAASGIPVNLGEAGVRPWLQLDMRWGLAIAALWAAAFFFRAVDLAIHSLRLRKLWKSATPVEPAGSLHASLAHLTLRGRGPVQLCTTKALQRPSVIGFLAPRILIPEWLLARLTPGELEQIVLHEAEHLRRGDDWTNLFQKLCLAVFPLNPALWWMERRLCREREMACDDGVVRITHAPRAYAACLASLAERGMQRRAEALSLGAWQRRPEVVHRVHSVLKRKYALSPLATRALLGALGCGLLFGSVELAQCPQWIAFVPTQKTEPAQGLTPSRTIAEPARVLRAPVLRVADTLVRRAKPLTTQPSAPRKAASPDEATREEASSSQLDTASPRPVLLKAEIPGPPADSEPAQEWIVFTAWEQVQTSGQTAGQAAQPWSDYDAGEGADPRTNEAAGQPNGQVTGRITITRLIFRVLPAASKSSKPIAVPVRRDWFVIQL